MSVSIDPEREPRPAGERLRIALIADTFTTAALGGAADCTLLSRKTYRQQIEEGEFDLFVCESAWEGPGGEWRRGVGWYSEQEFSDLKTVLALFRKRGVAAVFFNKEDPVHFDRFSRTAAHFDHVVTTDAHMVPRYLGLPDSRILTAEARPFFADPHTHHPFGDALRDDVICYAGTYYGARYPERTRHLAPLLEEASRHNLVIYDRQSLLPDSPYPLPAELKSHAAGGLSYEEMLQAYRRHAVFLNVNSVEKSPTMFSRRVVEALASGAAVISGPGAAIGEQFHGVIPVVSTADEARTVLGDVADDPAYRESLAAAGARVVLSRHLASHWLGAVAARAGLHHAGAFAPPSYAAVVTLADDVDTDMLEAALDGLFHQSLPPVEVRVARDEQWAQQHFGDRILNWRRWADEAGVAFSISTSATPPEADYVVTIDPRAWYGTHCFQDLLNLAAFGPADRIGKGAWVDLDALERRRFVTQGGDSELKREVELDTRCVLRRVGTPETETRGVSGNLLSFQPTAPNRGLRRMLVAGHDLKFIRPYFPHFEAAGYEIMVDEWKGHDRTEQAEARRLLEKADVIFCEWMLGNARWYARNVRPHQTLVCRFHRQELETRFPKDLDIERFHRVFFVGAETRDQALTRFQWTPDSRFVVTGNGVDIEALDRPKLASARFTLGLVGMVPSLKRVDRALDILAALRARDPRFHLRIKGKRPSEYAWLAKNPSEMEYFKRFWDRLKNDPLVSGAVHLDPHGPDMAEWYTRIGFVLSTSTLESFHMTVADGAASRAVPVVLPWAGAEAIYGPQWLHSDTDSAASKIAELAVDEQHWQTEGDTAQAAIAQRYDLTHVADRIIRHLRMDDFERIRPLHLPRH